MPQDLPGEEPFEPDLPEPRFDRSFGVTLAGAGAKGSRIPANFTAEVSEPAGQAGLGPDPQPGEQFLAEPGRDPESVAGPVTAAFITDEAPMALDVDGDLPADAGPVAPPSVSVGKDRQKFGGLSILQAFSTRRNAGQAVAVPAKPTAPVQSFRSEPRLEAISPAKAAPKDPQSRPDVPESAGLAVIGAASAPAKAVTTPSRVSTERPNLARPLPGQSLKVVAAKAGAAKGLKGFSALITAPAIAGNRKTRPPISAAAMAAKHPAGLGNSADRANAKPLAFGTRPIPQRGRPRYLGLILTGALLVLLALVAAWSTFFLALNDDPTTTDATAVASVSATPDGTIPAVEDEMLADQQDPAEFTPPETAEQNIAADLAADLANGAAAPETAAVEDPAPPAPQTGLTDGATTTPQAQSSAPQDEIFLAAIDRAPEPPDPSALGVPETRTDGLPAPAVPPPPFGTVYQFDAAGNIVPTPEGIATPEGVLLIAGKPPVVPTSRPASVVAAAAAALATAAAPGAGTVGSAAAVTTDGAGNPSTLPQTTADPATAATPTLADPALKDFRPVSRPAGLVVPAQNGALQDPNLAPQAGSRFASLRPQPRPSAIAALAAPAPSPEGSGAQTASLVANGQVLAADSSAAAVPVSRKPNLRPADLSRSVEAAVAEAIDQPEADLALASASGAAKAAPEADAEPESNGPMPTLPTSASVAKQATVKDAVNLSKMTLIGIYGTSSSRYALVRQPNGRLVKVRVGDRLDGGKVAAISSSELIYQKGGRAVTLEMPRT